MFFVGGEAQYDITPLVGSVSWSSSHRELAQKLNFSVAFNDDRYFPIIPVELGGLIVLMVNGVEAIRGVVVDETRSGRGPQEYTGMDFAFYLNRFADTYQFNGVLVETAIRQVCTDAGISIGNISAGGVRITKIYKDTSRADIISDIREQVEAATKKSHRLEMRGADIYFEPSTAILARPTFKQAENLTVLPGTAAISNPSRAQKITWGKEGEAAVEEITLTLPGDPSVRAGRVLEIDEPVAGLSGKYFITDAAHTIEAGVYTVALGLEVA